MPASLGVFEAAFKMTNYVLILKNMHALKDISKPEHGREGIAVSIIMEVKFVFNPCDTVDPRILADKKITPFCLLYRRGQSDVLGQILCSLVCSWCQPTLGVARLPGADTTFNLVQI